MPAESLARGPHNDTVDARLWIWPHSPPEKAAGQSLLSLALLRRRVLQRQIHNAPRCAAVVRDSPAHTIPYPVHGRLAPQSLAPIFRECARLTRANLRGVTKRGNKKVSIRLPGPSGLTAYDARNIPSMEECTGGRATSRKHGA
jgi:hypothetical protein